MLVMVLQGLFLSCRSQINESDPSPEAGWTIVRRVSAGPLQAKPQPRIRTNPQMAVNIAAALVYLFHNDLGLSDGMLSTSYASHQRRWFFQVKLLDRCSSSVAGVSINSVAFVTLALPRASGFAI